MLGVEGPVLEDRHHSDSCESKTCPKRWISTACIRVSKGGIHLTVLREKPHFSAPGEPFINSMIGAWLISLPSLVFRSSAGCAAVAGANAFVGAGAAGTAADEGPGAAAPPPALRAITCDVISGAFAPTTPPTFSPPCASRVRGNIVSGVGLTLLLKLSLFQSCSGRSSDWPRVGLERAFAAIILVVVVVGVTSFYIDEDKTRAQTRFQTLNPKP